MSADPYHARVALLLRVLPIVGRERDFALKGGTAINLFVRDLPRLSVDIDLTFLPLTDRESALGAIGAALERVASAVPRAITGSTVHASPRRDSPKLTVSVPGALTKVEPNTTLRGSVFEPEIRRTTAGVEAEYEQSVSIKVLSLPDLYGGKLVAALDRQHPRDLFDAKLLLDEGGFTNEVRTAFVVYLASHSRPMAELLDPTRKPLAKIFDDEFAGMSRITITVGEVEDARERLIRHVQADLTGNEREFLLSLKKAQPRWDLLPVPHVGQMPAIRWKLRNVEELAKRPKQHEAAVRKLRNVLQI
jgi:predicted nucleotidyltransferase component of viral defense system